MLRQLHGGVSVFTMMVIFVSQCQKKALLRTRRVLDAFAERIGDYTWRTIITEEGLLAVKKQLRKTASKNTAVACHWIRSRQRSDVIWVVGNRQCFKVDGTVPVNRTQRLKLQKESHWNDLPAVQALAAMAALLHDWGKATSGFQNKLSENVKKADPLRHEWVSCLLFSALVKQAGSEDADWLGLLKAGEWDESTLIEVVRTIKTPLQGLPPIAQMVVWLMLSHHRLPSLDGQRYAKCSGECHKDMAAILDRLQANWGYEAEPLLNDWLVFGKASLSQSTVWLQALQKWANALLVLISPLQTLWENGAYRLVLQHARHCLILSDHHVSSQPADQHWQTTLALYANTERTLKQGAKLKQKLDEHLVRVCRQVAQISYRLPNFVNDMERAYDIRCLNQKSPAAYQWQDKALETIRAFRETAAALSHQEQGWFVVNMASTGCGKTIANAKIMQALSPNTDSLRFVLALGLRTLTLQTGDEYRKRIGLDGDDLAVVIGSAAVQALHKANTLSALEKRDEEAGSESLATLLDEELDFTWLPTPTFLETMTCQNTYPLFQKKHSAFLCKPVLVCTIDHMMAATETCRGGKAILPYLRLLSSDLVIDEVDDFNEEDLRAIGRLVHLAGMLGRKVMISSATIPPAVAEGYFYAYQAGWRVHQRFLSAPKSLACAWVDEFACIVQNMPLDSAPQHDSDPENPYRQAHHVFTRKRSKALAAQPVKRKAYIVRDEFWEPLATPITPKEKKPEKLTQEEQEQVQQRYQESFFRHVQETALALHQHHHTIDSKTGKRVSFGVVRMANIPPCVALSRYLLGSEWPDDLAPRVMAYHSRQVLLLRSEQEQHLDAVLKRKEAPGEAPAAFAHPLIRAHLDKEVAANMLFIVVATPVEEVGRDHDFDWAVIEPSSYRSFIQMAGRVHRHRPGAITEPNIAIMQYNLRALRNYSGGEKEKEKKQLAYWRPGYESNRRMLFTHDVSQLVDEAQLKEAINAIPRIQLPGVLEPAKRLADLEHDVLNAQLVQLCRNGARLFSVVVT